MNCLTKNPLRLYFGVYFVYLSGREGLSGLAGVDLTKRTDIQVVSAHYEPEAAEAAIAWVKRVAALGELFDEAEVEGIVALLREAGEGEPEPLSCETICTIYRTIEAAVWKQEQ